MQRDDLIDALRGLALFGILAVNIQSFVWGVGSPSLGVLFETSSIADEVCLFFTALLFEYKFYPIFCFCFGVGFAVQTRRWTARGINAHARFTRRMNFMLLMGIAHGLLLWFGDILARYAIAGYLLRRHIRKGPRTLLGAAKFWLIIVLVTSVLFAVVAGVSSSGLAENPSEASSDSHATQMEAEQDGERVFAIYTEADYIAATIQRANDFFIVTATYIFVLPQVMLLFLLGALTAQLKWLRYPARYRSFWQRVFWFGLLVGLPINIAFAISQLSVASNPWMPTTMWQALLGSFAPVLALSYVAAFALVRASQPGLALIRLFAPAGRLALTFYVSQSVLMALLLNGFGYGLGAAFGQFELFVTAIVLYGLLLAIAHLMQRFRISGPLEGIWRRYTDSASGSYRIKT